MSATSPIFSFTEPTVGGDNGVWGGFLNTNLANLDTYLGILRQAEKTLTIGATTTLDFNAPASVFKLTVTQATTLAIANTPANITAQQLSTQFTLILVNGGAFAVTFPGSFVWSGGLVPNLQVSGTDVILGWSPDNGTTWYVAALTSRTFGAQRIGQLGQQTTASASEVSLGTVVLPAGKLTANGDQLRIHVAGTLGSGGIIRVKFGATYLSTISSLGNFDIKIILTRLGATTQVAVATEYADGSGGGPVLSSERRLPAETLANPVTIDFRGSQSGGSITLDGALVEAITQ